MPLFHFCWLHHSSLWRISIHFQHFRDVFESTYSVQLRNVKWSHHLFWLGCCWCGPRRRTNVQNECPSMAVAMPKTCVHPDAIRARCRTRTDELYFWLITRCIACLRQATFLFVNGIWWNCSKTIVSMSLECVQSFIKIGGVVFEKTR